MKKVRLKTIEWIKEEGGYEGVRGSITFKFSEGFIPEGMKYLFGKEVIVTKLISDDADYDLMGKMYDYYLVIGLGPKVFYIREDWIDYTPDITKEISALFDDILKDL